MDTGSGESHVHLRQVIDDEINSLEQSIQVLKARRNALAPMSCLPPETLAAIFSFLPPSMDNLQWIHVSHVCRQWREAALNHPRLWSHIKLSKPAPAAVTEILARAKMAPLHLDVDFTEWRSLEQINAFERQLKDHISHTHHLRICGLLPQHERYLPTAATPVFLPLIQIPLSHYPSRDVIPVNLFDCTSRSLTSLELQRCDISWKSPLLKGLQVLEIRWPSQEARPKLEAWLDALNEMPQLRTLSLHSATPVASQAPLLSEPSRTVALPSLTKFQISASARSCTLAFAHLVMPALTSLHVVAEFRENEGEDMQQLIPYVARNVCGWQDTEPLRSILISGEGKYIERKHVNVFAWIMPDADIEGYDPNKYHASIPARLTFTATSTTWFRGVDIGIFDALLTLLPMESVSTIIAHNYTRLSKEFWLRQAPRLPSLEQAHLAPSAVKAFRDMLAEDIPPDGPRLPSLTKLIVIHVILTAPRTLSFRDMLIERAEQGVPLDVLDLRTCTAPEHIIQLLREIVVDVKEPARDPMENDEFSIWGPSFFDLHAKFGSWNEARFDDDPVPLHEEDGAEYDEYHDDD